MTEAVRELEEQVGRNASCTSPGDNEATTEKLRFVLVNYIGSAA